ncbi:MAG TPA: metallophosphoesterase family protein [Gemmata sp.]|nr:metallophosphoesterase family protein [Gemmata sp.]
MRLLAIGDIHGCLGAFNSLLDWVQPATEDVVVALGDYVDRGPDSNGVLDRLIALKKELNLICLRGNHEQMMLDARRGTASDEKMWLGVGGAKTLESYAASPGRAGTLADVPREHWDFLSESLASYHETDRFIFVHATVLTDHAMADQPDFALLWDFLPDTMRHYSGKIVICGHTNQKSGEPKVIPGAVCIDTCVYRTGWLTCLEAATGQFWQADPTGRRREGQVNYD